MYSVRNFVRNYNSIFMVFVNRLSFVENRDKLFKNNIFYNSKACELLLECNNPEEIIESIDQLSDQGLSMDIIINIILKF